MEEGELFHVEYDVWIMPDDEDGEPTLFDTADEELAKEEDIFNEDATYGPKAAQIGQGNLLEGFEEALEGAEVGDEDSVEVPPEKGIGLREAEKIELFSRREMDRRGIDPVAGKEVEIDDRRGTIIQATAGRVRVDFNHPLAGKTLKYDYKITDKPESDEEIVDFILEKDYKDEDFEVVVDEDRVDITLPESSKYDQAWFASKLMIVGDLRNNLDVEKIRLIEEYEGQEEEPEEEEAEEEVEEETKEEDSEEKSEETEESKEDSEDEEEETEDE